MNGWMEGEGCVCVEDGGWMMGIEERTWRMVDGQWLMGKEGADLFGRSAGGWEMEVGFCIAVLGFGKRIGDLG